MTEQSYEGHETSIYSAKDSRKFKDIQARLLFNLHETSVTRLKVGNVCNSVLFLIAGDWFLPIIASKTFCI